MFHIGFELIQMEKWNWNLKMDIPLSGSFVHYFQIELEFGVLDFLEGGRRFREKPSEQGWELTTISTHKWHKGQESNPGHIGRKQALSPLHHPY